MPSAVRVAAKIIGRPSHFALRVIKQFQLNQGLLLAGAVAYYALLSLVPFLILIVMLLTQFFTQEQVFLVLREYLEFIVPGQSAALIEGLQAFLDHQAVVGAVSFITMLFFSSLAFTVLEKAMAVIFTHRVTIRRRHFLVSAIMPYLFILFLAVGLVVVTFVSGLMQAIGARNVSLLGHLWSLSRLSATVLYFVGVAGQAALLTAVYLVMPVGRLSPWRAFVGGCAATGMWEITRHILGWYYATVSQIQIVYGSLTTSVGVLLSAEFGAIVLLLGAQVIAEYETASRGLRENTTEGWSR